MQEKSLKRNEFGKTLCFATLIMLYFVKFCFCIRTAGGQQVLVMTTSAGIKSVPQAQYSVAGQTVNNPSLVLLC